jgi:hypothetical protein
MPLFLIILQVEACLYDERKESVGPDLIKISTPSSLSDTHCYEFMDSTNFTNEPSSFIPCFVHSIQPKQQQDQAVIISPTEHHCKEFTQIPRLVTLSSASAAAAASENTVKNLNHNNHHNNNHSERKGSSIMDRHDLPSPLENDISSHDILFPRGKEVRKNINNGPTVIKKRGRGESCSEKKMTVGE